MRMEGNPVTEWVSSPRRSLLFYRVRISGVLSKNGLSPGHKPSTVGADPKGAPSQVLGKTCPALQHSPEAVPVVEPALGQEPLHQVHPLPTGCACAAGGLLSALLGQAA